MLVFRAAQDLSLLFSNAGISKSILSLARGALVSLTVGQKLNHLGPLVGLNIRLRKPDDRLLSLLRSPT